MTFLDALAITVLVIVLVAIGLLAIELTMYWMYCLRNKIVEERSEWGDRKRMQRLEESREIGRATRR